jgi:hypothetical protein
MSKSTRGIAEHGQVGFYHFDEGQRESIRRIISTAESMLIFAPLW